MNDPTSDPELWQLDTIWYLIGELPSRHLDWLLEPWGKGSDSDNLTWWTRDWGKAHALIETLEELIKLG